MELPFVPSQVMVPGVIPAAPLGNSRASTRYVLLLTRLAPEKAQGDDHQPLLQEHLQQLLEQCGEVHVFRRGRGPSGQALSFGIVQFADAEAAWKASLCINKLPLCGQEVKVLVEENSELRIKQWRDRQKAVLKLQTDDEVEWELERKTVSCKALIEAKLEELYGHIEGATDAGLASQSAAERRKKLREREEARVTRAKKRKAWREDEYAKDLEEVLSEEKKRRVVEGEKDELADDANEELSARDKTALDLHVEGIDDPLMQPFATVIDSHEVTRMVDRVQAEPYERLFALPLDTAFLREEKILENKLRPWLERKIDVFMGGPQSDLVEHTLRRVNAAAPAETIASELARYVDDNADPLVERMWRMLVFELVRGGRLVLEPLPKAE